MIKASIEEKEREEDRRLIEIAKARDAEAVAAARVSSQLVSLVLA